MGWFIRLWAWLFEDKRSAWEQKRELQFITAINNLKNYSVSDLGGLSMDPEELRELVMTGRKELKHHVKSSSNRTTHAHQSTTAPLTSHKDDPEPRASRVDDLVEVVAWRRLTSGASVRYVCLQNLTTNRRSVAVADYFSTPATDVADSLVDGVTQRVANVIGTGEFAWFDTPGEAMDGFDKSV